MVSWSQTKCQSCGGVLNSLQLQDGTFRQASKNADDDCIDKLFQHSLVDVFTYLSETP